ncbi:hypothetical protein M094_2939 [Bacteroides uniformis str. 3978 T3 ii]|uniref:Uncharacterized protein n=1 Tax=Bacteroides uniformis str. 3978 T3 ii TaxID=1339349 RepID=A0A078RUS2_BACUN|nr:hypothetical protein M094_2939 [Bacteroides uniformis str. 3978 T3 ii]
MILFFKSAFLLPVSISFNKFCFICMYFYVIYSILFIILINTDLLF